MRYLLVLLSVVLAFAAPLRAEDAAPAAHDRLVALDRELRDYMLPGFTAGVVLDSGARIGDVYSDAVMAQKLAGLDRFENALAALPVASWPRPQQVDYLAVKSVLNGYRFNLEVLRPWKRDPGFYLDPLMAVAFTEVTGDEAKIAKLRERLRAVPPLLASARGNLTEVAGDFADLALHNLDNSDGVNHYHPYRAVPPAGIIGWYEDLLARSRKTRPDLVADVTAARDALVTFRDWLRAGRPQMTAPGGVGAARYDWYIRHVRMIPLTAAEMQVLAEREYERTRASLALLRHRNRDLPELTLSQKRFRAGGQDRRDRCPRPPVPEGRRDRHRPRGHRRSGQQHALYRAAGRAQFLGADPVPRSHPRSPPRGNPRPPLRRGAGRARHPSDPQHL